MIASWNFEPTGCHGADVKEWLASVKQPECSFMHVVQPEGHVAIVLNGTDNTVYFDMFGRSIRGTAVLPMAGHGNGVFIAQNGSTIRRIVSVK